MPRRVDPLGEKLTVQLHALLNKGVAPETVVLALMDACARRVVTLAPPADPHAVEQLAIAQATVVALGDARRAIASATRRAHAHAERLLAKKRSE